MRRQRPRSSGVPCQSRGYHAKGTDNVRPSASETVKASSVTETSRADGAWISIVEELIPIPQQYLLMVQDDLLDPVDLFAGKPLASLQMDRIEPEFRLSIVTFYMDVRRFIPVARVKEEAIRP
jgi:hypothetical protein